MPTDVLTVNGLNSFGPQGQVQPSTEQDLPGDYQSLKDEISQLKGIIASLESKVSALEATQDTLGDNQLIQLRLIADLRRDHEPQPLQKDRGEILRALLVANGGKMLAKDARQKMHLNAPTFSLLLSTMKDEIKTMPYHLNKSAKVLILR